MQVLEALFSLALASQCPDPVALAATTTNHPHWAATYGKGAAILCKHGEPCSPHAPLSARSTKAQRARTGLGYHTLVDAISTEPTNAAASAALGRGLEADTGAPSNVEYPFDPPPWHRCLCCLTALHQPDILAAPAALAAVTEAAERGHADVWEDPPVLAYLKAGTMADTATAAEKYRVARRAASYTLKGDKLHRIMADGSTRQVPPPSERLRLTLTMHEQCGHYGRKRTASLLLTQY